MLLRYVNPDKFQKVKTANLKYKNTNFYEPIPILIFKQYGYE
jgi:hypothetical protein